MTGSPTCFRPAYGEAAHQGGVHSKAKPLTSWLGGVRRGGPGFHGPLQGQASNDISTSKRPHLLKAPPSSRGQAFNTSTFGGHLSKTQ